MELIYSISMRICVTAILGAVIEYILPEGTLKRSAVRAVGLVMLINIAEPVAAAVRGL